MFSNVRFVLQDLSYQEVVEEWAYTFIPLVCDIGECSSSIRWCVMWYGINLKNKTTDTYTDIQTDTDTEAHRHTHPLPLLPSS